MGIITLEDYAMGRDLLYPEEWATVRPNAELLLTAVNDFLGALFPDHIFLVSSGWRPLAVNAKTPNAAKKSYHITGLAIDIKDHDKFLLINLDPEKNPAQAEALRARKLFMEKRVHTPRWCHFDLGDRPDRPARTFGV